jgi:PBP1b-binding outer membrane lipoprotein LpoB
MKKISAAIAALAVAAMLFTGCEAAKNNPQGTTAQTTKPATTNTTTTDDLAYATTTTPYNPTVTMLAGQPDSVGEGAN